MTNLGVQAYIGGLREYVGRFLMFFGNGLGGPTSPIFLLGSDFVIRSHYNTLPPACIYAFWSITISEQRAGTETK